MDNLLDLKKQMRGSKLFIFPTDSLVYEYLSINNLRDILDVVCTELSQLDVNTLYRPDEVADVALGSLDEDLFNGTEWQEVKQNMYDLVVDFSDIIFQGLQVYVDLSVIDVDINMIKISYQEKPGENY